MTAIAAAIDLLFADPNMARAAVYTPDGGAPVEVRVVAKRPDEIVGFGETRIHAGTTLLDVRVSEVAAPRPGDGVKAAGDGLKGSLRKQAVAAGLGARLSRTWRGRVEIEVYVEAASAGKRDAAFDTLVQKIGAILDSDPTLGGFAFGMTYARPEIETEAGAGAPAIKTGTIEVIVEYETETPLG